MLLKVNKHVMVTYRGFHWGTIVRRHTLSRSHTHTHTHTVHAQTTCIRQISGECRACTAPNVCRKHNKQLIPVFRNFFPFASIWQELSESVWSLHFWLTLAPLMRLKQAAFKSKHFLDCFTKIDFDETNFVHTCELCSIFAGVKC